MKKLMSFLLILSLLCGVWVFATAEKVAETPEPERYTSGDFEYIILEDGMAEIVKYSGKEEELIIPEELDGKKVTSIGTRAFDWCGFLTSVTIPDSVTGIEANPFVNCSRLTDIIVSPDHPYLATIDGVLLSKPDKRLVCYLPTLTSGSYSIPNEIQIIGENAFFRCDSLTSILIPDSVTSIGGYAFSSCSSLASITIPNSVTSIGEGAFFGCTALSSVTIPDSVIRIGDRAFSDCRALVSITIPDSVTSIGKNAFSGCRALVSITIPDSVTSIGVNPFYDCRKLTDIIVSPDHPYLATIDGVLFSKPDKRLVCYPCALTADSYSIPKGIQVIGERAFSGCAALSSVTIPDSVTSIGDRAFFRCESLKSVTIPDGVTRIGDSAFYGCSSLASITIPGSVTRIGDYAFSYCYSLTAITIPDSVTNIGYSAFLGCEALASVTIPDSVTSIGEHAFSMYQNDEYIPNPSLTLTVSRDSYAEQYCKGNGLEYVYPDAPAQPNN